jgi:hypothetical protein
MFVLHNGVVDALQFLVGKIKTECVVEIEEKGLGSLSRSVKFICKRTCFVINTRV